MYYDCGKYTARLVEWDSDNRVPLEMKDVAVIVEQIIVVGRGTGV